MTRATFIRVILLLALPAVAGAQPSVTATSGTWNHRATVTIAGAGFGSKSSAAPVIWDDASGGNILDKWDGAWPNNNSTYNLGYRSPMRGIGLPHSHITRYIAGAHGTGAGAQAGYNVIFFKNRTVSYPAYSYISWYQRADDAWVFGGDNNFKTFAYSVGDTPYEMPNNWYLAYNTPEPSSRSAGASYIFGDDSNGVALDFPDSNGHKQWWDEAVNPMSGVWTKIEMEVKYTNQNDGYVKLWENGVLRVNYFGHTDGLPGNSRTEGIGGYGRNYNQPNNWRYFADVYLDYSRARILLGNAPTYNASTIREVQVPQSWSGSSISLMVNLGKFNTGQTAYVYVVDQNGNVNQNGLPITVGGGGGGGGGGGDTTPPTVTSRMPATGATGVATTTSVTATFSEAINAATITPSTFELRDASNALVASAVSYNSSTRVATLDPAAALANSQTYTAKVKGGSSGVKDSAGNALASDVTWSFTTAAAADTTPPTVTAATPASGASGVTTSTTVTAKFSEAMNASTINSTTFELRTPSNALVASAISYNTTTRVATLAPASQLASSTTYTARVKGGSAGVKDSAGNALAMDFAWSFTTAAGGDSTPPTVSVTAPSNGATVSGIVQVSASASDNVGVVGVRFTVDDVDIGSEDTSSPYSVAWDTKTVGNGTHTLAAIARDAAGNEKESSPVTVSVANTGVGPTGLVAAFGFSEPTGTTANDASGRNNRGTISGAARTIDGKFGTALSFDGVDDWVTVADSSSLDLTTAVTIEAWVKPSTLTGWRSVIMKENSNGLSYALYANDNDPTPAAYVRIGGHDLSDAAGGSAMLPANAWTHLAATYDGANLRIYVNGVQAGITPVTGTVTPSSLPLRIGGNDPWGEFFKGVIDEVRVYNRALSANEIRTDMNTPVDGILQAPAPPINLRIVQ